jgi:hypothetical protein
MSLLAEDLLKNRSISDLKNVVTQLQIDSEQKKAELQGMVGSQYHEFIQSADKIAEMRKHSEAILSNLKSFTESKAQLIENVSVLLNQDKTVQNESVEIDFNEFLKG